MTVLCSWFFVVVEAALDVVEVVDDFSASYLFLVGQVRHPGVRIGNDLILPGKDTILPLKLLGHGVFEQLAALRHDVAELVS